LYTALTVMANAAAKSAYVEGANSLTFRAERGLHDLLTPVHKRTSITSSRASAQAAHDAAMLDAVEDWRLSSGESLSDMLFAEGQSRETFSVATANVYADWENGVGNLLGDKPEGTEWGGGSSQGDPYQDHGSSGGPGNQRLFHSLSGLDTKDDEGSGNDPGSDNGPQLPSPSKIQNQAPASNSPIVVINPTEGELQGAIEALLNKAAIDNLAAKIASQQRQADDAMQRIGIATGLSREEIVGSSLGELQLHAAFRELGELALRERIAERQAAEAAFAFGLQTVFDSNRNGDDLRALGGWTNGSDWDPWIDGLGEYVDGIEQIQMNTGTLGWSDYVGATNTDQFQGYGWTASKVGFGVARDIGVAAATLGTGNLIIAGRGGVLIRSVFAAGQTYEGYNTMNSSYHAVDQYSQGNFGTGTLYFASAALSGGTFVSGIARPGVVRLNSGGASSVGVSKEITVTGVSQDVSQVRSLLHHNDSLVQFGAKVNPIRGVTDVISHADEIGFQGVVGRELVGLSPADLAAYLQLHGRANGPIRLIACSAGKLDDGAASQVARNLGVRVCASNDIIDVLEDGTMIIRNGGRWRWFGPDGNQLD
jgi:hypothetical protein